MKQVIRFQLTQSIVWVPLRKLTLAHCINITVFVVFHSLFIFINLTFAFRASTLLIMCPEGQRKQQKKTKKTSWRHDELLVCKQHSVNCEEITPHSICLRWGVNMYFAYGPADATIMPSSLVSLKSRTVYLSDASLCKLPWKKGIKCVVVT